MKKSLCFLVFVILGCSFQTKAQIAGPSSVCAGDSILLTDGTTGGTWSSSNTAIATIDMITGNLTGISAGVDTIIYTAGIISDTAIVTINPIPGVITGPISVCPDSTITLADTSAGTWSSGSSGVATVDSSLGTVTGVSSGTTAISYSFPTGCYQAVTITVNPSTSAGTISGTSMLCVGAPDSFSDTSTGGVWSSSDITIASVDGSGNVTGIAAGIATISYTVSGICGTAIATMTVTINPLPDSGTISGSSGVCTGVPIVFTDTASGGYWSSSATGIATVDGSGNVTGLSAGAATISYSVTNFCGTAIAVMPVTVVLTPATGIITGSSNLCVGGGDLLTGPAPGGVWTTSAVGIASVSGTGTVTGVSTGTATISYSVSNSCGSAAEALIVTVNPLPYAGTLSGPSIVCAGSSITLITVVTGGVWSGSVIGIATVSATGIVNGIAAGTANISYTVTNSCGASSATSPVTVNPLPMAGTILGGTTVCVDATDALIESVTGGVWSSGTTAVATVNSTGTVTGVTVGTSTISYTVTNGCGVATATQSVVVNPLPGAGAISGLSSICVGGIIVLSESVSGGIWSSSEPTIATITASGVATGSASGSAVLNYSVTNSCGTAVKHDTISVNPLPFAGSISGASSLCVGDTVTLTETVTTGVWSETGLYASLSDGTVIGSIPGVDTIKYSVVNGCGSAVAAMPITINALPLVYFEIGGGSFCAGGAGVDIGMGESQTGVYYQLLMSSIPVRGPVLGTGSTLDFGLQTAPGSYTVTATDATTLCSSNMTGSATVTVNPVITPSVTVIAHPGTRIGVGESDTMIAVADGGGDSVTYQWYLNGVLIPGATTTTYVSNSFFEGDSVSCEVTSTAACGMTAVAHVFITLSEGVKTVNAAQEFIAYPNPNNGMFALNLATGTDEAVHIVVTNIVGEKVGEFSAVTNKVTLINLNVSAGIYLLSATTSSGRYVTKVTVN